MFKIIKNIYLTNRFFLLFGGVIGCFVISFSYGFLFPVAQTLFVLGLSLVAVDIYLLFNPSVKIKCRRRLPKLFSLGDANAVKLELHNQSNQQLKLRIIDELPFQFQKRDFVIPLNLKPDEQNTVR